MKRNKRILRLLALTLAVMLVAPYLQPSAEARDTTLYDDAADVAGDELGYLGGATATSTLSVIVGYFGGPYTLKHTFTVVGDTLYDQNGNDLSQDFQQQTYTYIDSGGQVCIDETSVIPLETLMGRAGIDSGSVQWYHFRTGDEHQPSLTRDRLEGETRYYYPELVDGPYDILDDVETNEEGLVFQGVEVPVALAVRDNWRNNGREGESTLGNAMRLLFGQTSPTDSDASNAVKWCYAIVVQLGGTPNLSVNVQEQLDATVGSTYHVTVNVNTLTDDGRPDRIDADIAQQIASSLMPSSSNDNIASIDPNNVQVNVDADGNVYVSFDITLGSGDGDVEITLDGDGTGYNGAFATDTYFTATVEDGRLTVSSQGGNVSFAADTSTPSDEGESSDGSSGGTQTNPDEGDSGNGESNDGSNGGTQTNPDEDEPGGSEGGEASGDSEQTEQTQNPTGSSSTQSPSVTSDTPNSDQNVQTDTEEGETEPPEPTDADENALVDNYTPETEEAPTVNSLRVHRLTIDSNEGAEQNWRDTDMAEDAVELGVVEEDNPMLVISLIAMVTLLLVSMLLRYLQFLNELGEAT